MSVVIITIRDVANGKIRVDVDGDEVDLDNLTPAQKALVEIHTILLRHAGGYTA